MNCRSSCRILARRGTELTNDACAFAQQIALASAFLGCALLVVVLQVVVDGNDALRGELLDLIRAILPLLNVGRVLQPQRPTGEDDGACFDEVVHACVYVQGNEHSACVYANPFRSDSRTSVSCVLVNTASLCLRGAPDSCEATNRVPTHTPSAP